MTKATGKKKGRPIGSGLGPTSPPATLFRIRIHTRDLLKTIAYYENVPMIDVVEMLVAKKALEYPDE